MNGRRLSTRRIDSTYGGWPLVRERADLLSVAGAGQEQASAEHGDAPDEGDVPGGPVAGVLADVVEREDVVVDGALDEVEGPPTHQQETRQRLAGPRYVRITARMPREPEAGGVGDVGHGVEEAVLEGVGLEAGDGGGRMAALAGEQVVPLEDLVEDDAVEEAANGDAE